ncbi:hypothetical protein Angca_006406, partial [Angiostrongylus cantonensis]
MSSSSVVDETRTASGKIEPTEGFTYSTWSPAPTSHRSTAVVFVAVLSAIFMLIFGVLFGVFLHSVLFSNETFRLALMNSTTCDPNAVPPPCDEWSLSDSHDNRLETSTADVYGLLKQKDCSSFPWKSFRLPRDIAPKSYNLTIHPNITANKLTGNVIINIEVLKMTKLIVLHYNKIEMKTFTIMVDSKRMDAEFHVCPKWSQWAFLLGAKLAPGEFVQLEIEFNGEVLADMSGLYISTHTDSFGRRLQSAVTQFEPAYARKMFPCFDEPNFKATFQLSVIREPHHVVISNTPIKESKTFGDRLYMDIFHKTVQMSTYLLAVAILDGYDFVEKTATSTKRPIMVRLYAPRDVLIGQSEFALNTAVRALEYFEDYFNIAYTLKKMDLVALDDFSAGAMENWGLMTFPDSLVLYTDGVTSISSKECIALVICHEVSHQWFGNLVTMDWWDDLGLNEGFASYMEFRCVDRLFPEWNIVSEIYDINYCSSSPNRTVDVIHHGQGSVFFCKTTVFQGSAIIRMVESLAGETVFKRSLIEYLNKYAYANAKGSHLWEIFERHTVLSTGISFQDVANSYFKKVGCPEIFVTLSDTEITVHNQTRFLFDDGSRANTRWPIPIYYRTDDGTESQLQWMKVHENKVSWHLEKSAKWVVANTNGLSYVKVRYDAKNYAELAGQLRTDHTAISAIDRTVLLVDAFDFSKSSKLSIEVYLNLLLYATEEMDHLVWMMIDEQMRYIESLVEETPVAESFKNLQRALVKRPYERVGWSTNTSMTPAQKILQATVIGIACRLRIRDCIKKAQAQFDEWSTNGRRPSPELFRVVLREGICQGDQDAWDSVYKAYQNAKSPTEKNDLLVAMASTTQTTLVHRMLRHCLDGSSIRPNVVPSVLFVLSKNSATRTLTWRFFRVNYKYFVKMFGDETLLVKSIKAMADDLSTEEELDDLRNWLSNKKLVQNKATLGRLFDQIR